VESQDLTFTSPRKLVSGRDARQTSPDRTARYPTGFGTSLAVLGFGNIIVPTLYWLYCGRINKRRDAISKEEIHATYSQDELADMGDLSPLYKYER